MAGFFRFGAALRKPIIWLLGASLLFNVFLLGANSQKIFELGSSFASDTVSQYKAYQAKKELKEFEDLIKNDPVICRQPLMNAMLLNSSPSRYINVTSNACISSKRGHDISIKNGSNANAIVKIKHMDMNQTYVSFLVLKGQSVSESCIPDGTYKVQFGFGDHLNEQCSSFLKLQGTQEFRDSINLQTRRTNRAISWQQITFTLYPVPEGNAQTDTISEASFKAD